MNSSLKVLLSVIAFIIVACEHEKKINNWREEHTAEIYNFDIRQSTIHDLVKVIDESSEKGSLRVKFPKGEWNYYCNHCEHLPTKERWAKIELSANELSADVITDWLDKNGVKGVNIQISPAQMAERFFFIEKILREHGVIYWLERSENIERELIVMRETNGDITPGISK